MNIPKLAIKRPIMITAIVILIFILGIFSYRGIGLELLPNYTLPVISVSTIYAGATPEEIEKLISKPLEDELGSLSGIKHINSQNDEGISVVSIEFGLEIDADKAAQDVRDKVNLARQNLPSDLTEEPIVQKFNPDSSPIMQIVFLSDLPAGELYDLANERIKSQLTRINGVGDVKIAGGTKREIQIELDQNKLNEFRLPMTRIIGQIKNSGSNVSVGKKESGNKEMIFRTIGEFSSLDQIANTLLTFSGDVGNSVSVKDLGIVKDGTKDADSICYIYAPVKTDEKKSPADAANSKQIRSCFFLNIIKQSGANTVKVADSVRGKIATINDSMSKMKGNSRLLVAHDESIWVKTNVDETVNTIIIGIFLAILVVYLFLGNVRSTIITAIAIPNSLLGAIIIMNLMDYSFNLLTLLALSLVVGLLVDDAIVVIENIYHKGEKEKNPYKAAELGTKEVMLAVIATTLTIMAVFFPVGMMEGVVGKFFKPFGFTIIFAMAVSLFDALTVAPFMCAYFSGSTEKGNNIVVRSVDKFQDMLERKYVDAMRKCLAHPFIVIIVTLSVFASSIFLFGFVKKTFTQSGDQGEFAISFSLPAGSSLNGTKETVTKIEERLKKLEDLDYYTVTIGGTNGEPETASINCFLNEKRKHDTDANKKLAREFLSDFKFANPSVNDSGSTAGDAPFVMIVSGYDLPSVENAAEKILNQVKSIPDLVDIDSSMKKGKPELRVVFDQKKMQDFGLSDTAAGIELRNNISGAVVGKLRQNGLDYDIRCRLQPEQRDLNKSFYMTKVPNTSGQMIPLQSVATGTLSYGSSRVSRRDKAYIVKVSANLSSTGAVGNAMAKAEELIKKNVVLPPGVSYGFSGQAETFTETASSMAFALIMALLFIYLILACLYESFITPITILLAIPPALTGALLALFISNEMLSLMSMIGMVLLIGLVTKNSILLVDYALQGVRSGLNRKDAIIQAGVRRLRPILMTTVAMIAGMLPLAVGIGQAAKQRQSMGIAVIGGLIVSTLITLVVVPAFFEYIDRFRCATEDRLIVRENDSESKPSKKKRE